MERRIKYTLSLVSLLLLPSIGLSQVNTFTVDIIGQPDPTWEGNTWDLNATAEITFGLDGDKMNGFITVDLVNEGLTPSKIVEFYMMRPYAAMGNGFGGYDSAYRDDSDPKTWIMDNSIRLNSDQTTDYDKYLGNSGDYFGMHSTEINDPLYYPPTPPDTQGSGTFVFYFAGLRDMQYSAFGSEDWYNTASGPIVMLQWQGVGTNGENDISIGIGGPNYIPHTPEPAEVALLAMVGLGGLLWTRRRFTRK